MSANPFECKLCGHTTLHVDPRRMFCGNDACPSNLAQPTVETRVLEAARDLQERVMNTMERDWQAMEARADAPFAPAPCNCDQALRLQARVTELESQLEAACIERDSALLLLRRELNAL